MVRIVARKSEKGFSQPRTQASSRYPSDQRRLGTKRDRRIFPTIFPTSLTGDVTSEIAEDDWEQRWDFLRIRKEMRKEERINAWSNLSVSHWGAADLNVRKTKLIYIYIWESTVIRPRKHKIRVYPKSRIERRLVSVLQVEKPRVHH